MKILLHILKVLGFVVITVAFIFVGLSVVSPQNRLSTTDDTQFLPEVIEQNQNNQVLGATSEKQEYQNNYGCGEDNPIVGWIDYAGQKTIRENLPQGQTASTCFASFEEAEFNGYTKD